jgi:hypothetical protein
MTVVVGATWLPVLAAPFGDHHDGRVWARFALGLRNFHEEGLVGSSFATDLAPYGGPYAHHPPLLTALAVAIDALPGDGVYVVRLAPYLLGLMAIPAGAALLRVLGIRWVPTLLSLGLMVVTGLFWVFARLMFDLGTLLAMTAAIAYVRGRPDPPRWAIVAAVATSFVATVGSWPGIAWAAVLGLWLLTARRDRVTVAVGAAMVVGVILSASFMFGVQGIDRLVRQTEERTTGGDYGVADFFTREWTYLRQLLPRRYLVLLPVGIVAGVVDRRTRFLVVASTAMTIAWVLGLNNGAYIHDYWAYMILIPGLLGMGALLDRTWAAVPRRWNAAKAAAAIAVGALLAIAFIRIVTGPIAQDYIERPLDAGVLVSENLPPPGQARAWHIGMETPRWLAYYWQRSPAPVTAFLARRLPPDNVVLVDADRLPDWLPTAVLDDALATKGRYALLRMAGIRAAIEPG